MNTDYNFKVWVLFSESKPFGIFLIDIYNRELNADIFLF
jgi:hypothetical protein